MPLTLTDTARSFFTPGTAAFILANMELCRTRIAPPSPNKGLEHLSRWYFNHEQSQLASRVFYDIDAPDPDQWLFLDIAIPLCPGTVLGDVPEEHCTSILKDNKVWTLGDLAAQDPELYDGLDIKLTQEAFQRVRAMRMQITRENASEGGAP